MSLYCFGKIVPSNAKNDLEDCVPKETTACLRLNFIHPEDNLIICESEEMKQSGITFSYVSKFDDSDATVLWLAASEAAKRFSKAERDTLNEGYSNAIKATALGGFIWNLLNRPKIKHGAIALVDGGIETIIQADSKDCWNHFLGIIAKPWDCHDNPLYIWKSNLNTSANFIGTCS